MALKDQPYLPLYVQDVLTDEKLIECSAESQGVYFRLICVLHKQENYGKFLLKQKFKQNTEQIINFAQSLVRSLAFDFDIILASLEELIDSGVIYIDGDFICQKRMVKDGELSIIRTKSGKKGGNKVTKQHGQKGYFYFMSDIDNVHKIGVSINPKNRLYRLRSDNKLSKSFEIIDSFYVPDMGKIEDEALEFFNEEMNGEWLKGSFDELKEKFVLFEAKVKAKYEAKATAKPEPNTEYEIEYEYIDIVSNIDNTKTKVNINTRARTRTHEEITFPFPSVEFISQWNIWKDYKSKEHKFNFKTPQSEQAQLNKLLKLSNDNEANAIEILHQSMANGWKGIFEIQKQNHNGTEQQKQPGEERYAGYQTKQQVHDAIQRELANPYNPLDRE